jgi:hypothetical protein
VQHSQQSTGDVDAAKTATVSKEPASHDGALFTEDCVSQSSADFQSGKERRHMGPFSTRNRITIVDSKQEGQQTRGTMRKGA